MSLWSRLFGRVGVLGPAEPSSSPVDTLVEEPRVSATQLGAAPKITPWSATRLGGIFQSYESSPTYGSLAEARLARQCLSQFWLVAPVDQLEALYGTAIGDCYRVLLAGKLAQEPLLNEEQGWKNTLTQRLSSSFDRPETTNVLLAAMPYFPPGKMRVADPLSQVPKWLLEDYARLFDTELLQRIWRPAGLLGPVGQSYGQAPNLGLRDSSGEASFNAGVHQTSRQASDLRPQPSSVQLSARRGNDALELVQSGDFQGRMQGLINLHVIDPSDDVVQEQLVELRRLLGQIWLDSPGDKLESLYKSTFGQLYRDLLSSGFPKVALSQEDRLLRKRLAQLVADMSRSGAINALMAVLPFYAPGKIAFGGGEQHMPVWLVREISGLYVTRDESTTPPSDE